MPLTFACALFDPLSWRLPCLPCVQSTARKFKTAHHYKALGLTLTASEADIRKYVSCVLRIGGDSHRLGQGLGTGVMMHHSGGRTTECS